MRKLLSLLLALTLLVLPVTAWADGPEALTDEEVTELVRAELAIAREVAYYPAAFEGDFTQFYVNFHKLSLKSRTGITADDYALLQQEIAEREALTQIAEPADTVWEIWGEQMASEPAPTEGWELSYDNEGFRPFLNPYLIEDQSQAKGNVIVIAGGNNTHRCNQVEGYPVAEFFNANGYNAYVLQRRVLPYADADPILDVARAVRYIRYYGEEKGIGASDIVIGCGFSMGGINIMSAVGMQFGHVTPDAIYPDYVCDEVDQMSADFDAVLPIYGVYPNSTDYSVNPNLPPVFYAVGQQDPIFGPIVTKSLEFLLNLGTDVEFFLAPDAIHGIGLGTGTLNYIDGFTLIADWPAMAIRFLDTRLGYAESSWSAFPDAE